MEKIVVPQVAIDLWNERYNKKPPENQQPFQFDEDAAWLKSIKGDDYENKTCKKRV